MSGVQFDFSSFLKCPQDSLKNCTADNTSVFGNAANDYLSEIKVFHSNENTQTPFSYQNVIGSIYDESFEDTDKEGDSTIHFEC